MWTVCVLALPGGKLYCQIVFVGLIQPKEAFIVGELRMSQVCESCYLFEGICNSCRALRQYSPFLSGGLGVSLAQEPNMFWDVGAVPTF